MVGHYVLGARVVVQCIDRQVAAVTGSLESSPRNLVGQHEVRVDPDGPEVEAGGDVVTAAGVPPPCCRRRSARRWSPRSARRDTRGAARSNGFCWTRHAMSSCRTPVWRSPTTRGRRWSRTGSRMAGRCRVRRRRGWSRRCSTSFLRTGSLNLEVLESEPARRLPTALRWRGQRAVGRVHGCGGEPARSRRGARQRVR